MRVAELDTSDSSHQCPSGLRPLTLSGVNTCASTVQDDSGGCSIVSYSTANLHYSRVCGKILAYASGSPDAFEIHGRQNPTIESNYVDGVSLTHGDPRQHIWTFAAHQSMCNCQEPPSSVVGDVGDDYFCGTTSPLWDGASCSLNNPPWFYRQLPQPTTDAIEMRLCRDEEASNENIGIQTIEIYVQ